MKNSGIYIARKEHFLNGIGEHKSLMEDLCPNETVLTGLENFFVQS